MRLNRYGCFALYLLALLSAADATAAKPEQSWRARYDEADAFYRQGAFDRAAVLWREIASATASSDAALSVNASLGSSVASRQMGLHQEALNALNQAEQLLSATDSILSASFYQQLGNLYLVTHRHNEALDALSNAAARTKGTNHGSLRASILNDYGNALRVSGYISDALAAHTEALTLAREQRQTQLILSTAINVARLYIEQGNVGEARAMLNGADALLREVTPSYEWAMTVLALADVERALATNESNEVIRTRIARTERVRSYAVDTHHTRLLSLAYGDLAADHRALGDDAAAEATLKAAAFYAAQVQAHDLQYKWRWELARLQRRQGRLDMSIETFEQALATLSPIRQELLSGYRDSQAFFQRQVRPVYAEFVDALLARADDVPPEQQRAWLERVRAALEAQQSAELQDYFRDECVVAQKGKAMTLEQVAPDAAILYPIVLPDRVELLLSIRGAFVRHRVSVPQEQLIDSALRLREFVQDSGHTRFLPYANRLYRWLIEPVKAELTAANIATLVIVPDGVLRTVPFAALHDGERYLIQEWAVAITPGLTLTAAPRASPPRFNALLAGVAQSVQGFAPLPSVNDELASIRAYIGGTTLSNQAYTKSNLRAALMQTDYSIVHMATHGTVGATPADSFLLTYDDKLTMSDLESLLRIREFRDQPVDLLTLSACETAVGDERAALGLAGMAVKSGARSVVASLWLVDDDATAALMNRFYGHLGSRAASAVPSSKAKALRSAQLNLLGDVATEHPANWSAFMLIGHWQ